VATLGALPRTILERTLQMEGGYVLDFTDATFRGFVTSCVGIDPDDAKYKTKGTSKANRLRSILDQEPDPVVAKLLTEIVEYGTGAGLISPDDAASARSVIPQVSEHPVNIALRYPADWRFGLGPNTELPLPAVRALAKLVIKISAVADDKQSIIEIFKEEIASANGDTASQSSSLDWAESDLHRIMEEAATNAATFLDGFWSAIQRLHGLGIACPGEAVINKELATYEVPLAIKHPHLVAVSVDAFVDSGEDDGEARAGATRYRLGEVLGQGGYGVVHVATRETSFGTFQYALKLLDPSPFVENREKAVQRFRREVKAMLEIQHRGLVQYLDAGIDGQGRPYLVMPLIRGKNIRDATEGLSPREICLLVAEMLHAIGHAHQHDLLHRDLKPSNVLVRAVDMQVIIVDFGNAYILEEMDAETLTTSALGTVGYVPSEVLADPKKRSKLHDVYSCGIIAYEVYARRRPDPAAYQPLADIDVSLQPLDGPIKRAIASEHRRYQSADEFREALLLVAEQLG